MRQLTFGAFDMTSTEYCVIFLWPTAVEIEDLCSLPQKQMIAALCVVYYFNRIMWNTLYQKHVMYIR